jgi:uncharacterized membrane-anchored protein
MTPTLKTYIDLDVLKEREDPKYYKLQELLLNRMQLAATEKLAKERRQDADAQLKEFMGEWDAEVIILDDIIANIVERRGSGKWNKERLTMILTPEELEQTYTEGKSSKSLRVERNEKAVEKVREG